MPILGPTHPYVNFWRKDHLTPIVDVIYFILMMKFLNLAKY